MNWFSLSPLSTQELLELISETPSGQEVCRNLDSALSSGKIRIETYPDQVRQELIDNTQFGHPLGAAFVTDGHTGTIYLDLKSDKAVLAPFLLHEMTHSLDSTLWSAASLSYSKSQKKEILFQSECRAFHAQYRFLKELKTLYPALQLFYTQKYPNVESLHRAIEPSEIAQLYRL